MNRTATWLIGLALFAFLTAAPLAAQNSSKKIRPQPSETAARAGTAVRWRTDVEAALAEAKESGKPVFWYVPTIRGSFMDRKTEIDRYMLAGPFSWPRSIELLNAHYVPVREAGSRELCERFDLAPVRFIEPGYLVLDGDGKALARQDRITTFHPKRFLTPLAERAGVELAAHPFPGDQVLAEEAYVDGRWTGMRDWNPEQLEAELAELDAAAQPEHMFLRGVSLFHAARETEALALWEALAKSFPEHPLAWKAAMEVEGHGPLVHGFELYDELSDAALAPSGEGTRAPAGVYDVADVWERGVSYLRRMQRSGGEFDDSTYDFGGTDGLPNVFAAITALAAQAMLEAQARAPEPDPRTEEALQLARRFLSDEACINEWDTDEKIWAHVYRVRLFARWLELRPEDASEVRPVLTRIASSLTAMQGDHGAWYHEYANPFVTANCLIALHEAQEQKIEVNDLGKAVRGGVQSLLACRTQEGAFTYGFRPNSKRPPRASVEGGVGRIPLGELALHLWESEEGGDVSKAVALSFEHEKHLLPAQKYDDHTRTFAYGGFFFWYDLQARTDAIVAMPAGDARDAAIERQREQILTLPEFDGCFIDSHEIGRSYGTAMALICLATLE
ncbi:MAG: hypothetical protein GY711_35345 [bacterium]|nr:hypothetical protein [bacterium]